LTLTVADWDKLVKRIEDGEGRIQRREEMGVALDKKVARYKDPWESLKLNYGMKRGKQYIEEEDVFLVCMTQKLGYGNWDALKAEIRRAWQVRSRTPSKLTLPDIAVVSLVPIQLVPQESLATRAAAARRHAHSPHREGERRVGASQERRTSLS
jgi:SWI/SNF-related matrix-associated actin-dependent regulator of chromatin subfamily A member 5